MAGSACEAWRPAASCRSGLAGQPHLFSCWLTSTAALPVRLMADSGRVMTPSLSDQRSCPSAARIRTVVVSARPQAGAEQGAKTLPGANDD